MNLPSLIHIVFCLHRALKTFLQNLYLHPSLLIYNPGLRKIMQKPLDSFPYLLTCNYKPICSPIFLHSFPLLWNVFLPFGLKAFLQLCARSHLLPFHSLVHALPSHAFHQSESQMDTMFHICANPGLIWVLRETPLKRHIPLPLLRAFQVSVTTVSNLLLFSPSSRRLQLLLHWK